MTRGVTTTESSILRRMDHVDHRMHALEVRIQELLDKAAAAGAEQPPMQVITKTNNKRLTPPSRSNSMKAEF